MAIKRLLTAYRMVDQLLNIPLLNTPQLLALLESFTEQQPQSIARALEFEGDGYVEYL